MEQNKANRTEGNDILREAQMQSAVGKPDVAPDETIEFKAPTQKKQSADESKLNMEHTAQIRGGAVVRPLKQQPLPQPSAEKKLSPIQAAALRQKQAAANVPARPTVQSDPKAQPVPQKPMQVPQSRQPQPASTQMRPARDAAQSPTPTRDSTSIRRTQAENAQAAVNRARGENRQIPTAPTQKPAVQQTTMRNGTVANVQRQQSASYPVQRELSRGTQRDPAAKEQVNFRGASGNAVVQRRLNGNAASGSALIPIDPTNHSKPMPTGNTAVRPRTENDDFEIDELATRNHKYAKKHTESRFADSATSAVMSLIKAVVYIVVIIAVSVGLSVFVINTANDVFKFVVEDKIVSVNIPEFASIEDVADALYDSGAIKYKWAFNLWSGLKDSGAEFIPGTYEVSTALNYDYLRASFKKSTKRTELRITIPEGYTVDEIIDLLIDGGIGNVGDSETKRELYEKAFVDVINNYDFNYRFLETLNVTEDRIYRLEGYLFPDTYNFYAEYGTVEDSDEEAARRTAVSVISKLLDNFNNKFVSEYYDRCTDLGMTVDQAIILASMVEKETRYADELGYVSSVFHNRLKYPGTFPYLNSDATIMYAIAHDTGSRLDTMTGDDTTYDTPYNTYTHRGLPPGPIANPGLNAIKYALYPNDTKYFYFVSDSTGRTLFAETEPEHLANINAVRGQ